MLHFHLPSPRFPPRFTLSLKGSHGSFSLQATVATMPHSNRYFSARELRISFGTRIARITRICCLVSKDSRDSRDSCSKINTQYYFFVAHGSHGFQTTSILSLP